MSPTFTNSSPTVNNFIPPQGPTPQGPFGANSGDFASWFNVVKYRQTGDIDDGAAINRASLALIANGGGTLFFPPGNYLLFTTAGGFLTNFVGITGINIIAYGATFINGAGNAAYLVTAGYGAIFVFTNCTNIYIDGVNATGPDLSVNFGPGILGGINVVQLVRGNSNIQIPNMRVQGCQAGVVLPNTLANVAFPNRQIVIGNLFVEQTFYGVVGSYGIHDMTIHNLNTSSIYRSLFLTGGIRNLIANISSLNNFGHDVPLSANDGHGIDGVFLCYRRGVDSIGPTQGGTVPIRIGYADITPAEIKNIEIELSIDFAPGGVGLGAVQIIKTTDGDTPDPIDRGHVLDGLTIRGFIRGTPQFTSTAMIDFPVAGRFGPVLDSVRRLNFSRLTIETTLQRAIEWDCGAQRDTIVIDQVDAGTSIVSLRDYAGAAPLQTSSIAKIESRSSTYANQFVTVAGYFPIEVRSLSSDSQAIPAAWMTNFVIINDAGIAVDPHTNPLPAAVPGLDATFVNTNVWILSPDGTDIFRNFAIGIMLEMSTPGSSVRLGCTSPGIWDVLFQNGTIGFV